MYLICDNVKYFWKIIRVCKVCGNNFFFKMQPPASGDSPTMGCVSSSPSEPSNPAARSSESRSSTSQYEVPAGGALYLPHSKLRFSVKQLRMLNQTLEKLTEEYNDPITEDEESITERLVQSIVSGAATKDPRFTCKYIIALHKDRMLKSRSLEYLVLMDSLEGTCALAEGPPGCARLRPSRETQEDWQDLLTTSGFLRRDKVVERWVEVLAAAAAEDSEDDARKSPAALAPLPRIVRSATLHCLQTLKPEEQCYYDNDDSEFSRPSTGDYRIAIVEGCPWVLVRVAGGALGARGGEAKLALGLSYTGWPKGCDFPQRAPLGHPDALLFYHAAQTGFLVVGGAPAPGVQWSERCAGWQVWPGGARALCAARGAGADRVARAARALLKQLRDTGQPPLRAVSRFQVEEVLLWRLEWGAGRGPAAQLRSWAAPHLSHHVLLLFDTLLGQVRARTGRHYFFPGCDAVQLGVWRSARIGERDWRGDADCLAGFLHRLHEDSTNKIEEGVEIISSDSERLESALCCRWGLVLQELAPCGSTRGRRLAGAPLYSPRQLAYVAHASRHLLAARHLVIQESNEWFQGGLSTTVIHQQDPIEDLIHLLAVILDQARDYFLQSNSSSEIFDAKRARDNKNVLSPNRPRSSKDTLKRHKLKNCYDASAAYLIDAVRRDPSTQKEDLTDDLTLIKTLLRWLYKAVDDDKKYLSPVLKPYLELLFTTSHENCWHLEEMKLRTSDKELKALGMFCKSVNKSEINPADGIVDGAGKGWVWAENMLDVLEIVSSTGRVLRLVFLCNGNEELKFDLRLPHDAPERDSWSNWSNNKKDKLSAKLKVAERCVVEAFAFGLEQETPSIDSGVHSSKSEEILPLGRFSPEHYNTADMSTTHTLRSTTGTIDTMADSTKYHTLRSISSKYSTLRNAESLFGSCWSTTGNLPGKNKVFEESQYNKEDGYYDNDDDSEGHMYCWLRDHNPLQLALEPRQSLSPHREYQGIIKALVNMQRYSVLQELAGWLTQRDARVGALRALHRLARGGRRASGPASYVSPPPLPPTHHRHNYSLSPKKSSLQQKYRASVRQYYRRRNIDALSGDEGDSRRASRRGNKKKITSPENNGNSETLTTPRTKEDHLDLEIQQEYLKNKSLHNLCSQHTVLDEHYLDLCREAIRDSNIKRSNAAFVEFNREMKIKMKNAGKEVSRSSSVGRSMGRELTLLGQLDRGLASTVGRASGRSIQVPASSLLGTCREARLQHAARRAALPRAGSSGDPVFGDAFKVSPIYATGQSEYETMTQSILQGSVTQPGSDRQRHLMTSQTSPPVPAVREKLYP